MQSFSANVWDRIFPGKGKPKELETFKEIRGSKYTAVSTPGDILFHIRARQMGLCYEFASIIDEKLKGAVEAIDETHGFRYMDGKAIIGFVDGTESPAVDEDPYHFAVVGEEDPDFAGGCICTEVYSRYECLECASGRRAGKGDRTKKVQ